MDANQVSAYIIAHALDPGEASNLRDRHDEA